MFHTVGTRLLPAPKNGWADLFRAKRKCNRVHEMLVQRRVPATWDCENIQIHWFESPCDIRETSDHACLTENAKGLKSKQGLQLFYWFYIPFFSLFLCLEVKCGKKYSFVRSPSECISACKTKVSTKTENMCSTQELGAVTQVQQEGFLRLWYSIISSGRNCIWVLPRHLPFLNF